MSIKKASSRFFSQKTLFFITALFVSASFVVFAKPVSPEMDITNINQYSTPFPPFTCVQNPITSPVSISGNGVGSAPPGHIEQYAVQVDWGDGNVENNVSSTFTPNSGQANFSFIFNAGAHAYTTGGAKTIKARLYHQNPPGNDGQADSSATVDVCVTVPPPPPPPPPTQCADGIDNDDDGLVDLADPGCMNAEDNDETNVVEPPPPPPPTQCADTIDNDDDGLIDLADPGCVDAADDDETNVVEPPPPPPPPPPAAECADTVDNDDDGLTDENDPACHTDGNVNNPGSYSPELDDESDNPSNECADGLDNDDDGKIDSLDPGCWTDPNDPETYDATLEDETDPTDVCSNIGGIQTTVPEGLILEEGACVEPPPPPPPPPSPTDVCPNIEGVQESLPEGLILEEGNCVEIASPPPPPPPPPPPAPPPPSGGGNGSPFLISQPGIVLGASNGPIQESIGQVLGAETTCRTSYLKTFIKYGRNNDVEDVKRLQQFLNEYLGLNLPITGTYGPLTRNGVNDFQVRSSEQVLAPWVPYGLPSATTPTGYVYKTTQRWINLLKCPDLNLPMPQLP